jgi:cysteine sulfinate desulfinase/cysteine desulfurase-like protein
MGLSAEEAHCAVRFSLGTGNTDEDIVYVLSALKETLAETRSTIRFVSCR